MSNFRLRVAEAQQPSRHPVPGPGPWTGRPEPWPRRRGFWGKPASAAAEDFADALDAQGEVDVLPAARQEHADDLTTAIDCRAAGVARVGRRVRLHEPSGHPADDPRRDRATETVGAADEEQLLTRLRLRRARLLPERRCTVGATLDADERQVVLPVAANDLSGPIVALVRELDRPVEALDDVRGGDEVRAVFAAPPDEGGSDAPAGRDGEDALQDPPRDRRDTKLPLSGLETTGELVVVLVHELELPFDPLRVELRHVRGIERALLPHE